MNSLRSKRSGAIRPGLLFVLPTLLLMALYAVAARHQAPPLSETDRHFQEKSYAAALEGYQSAVKAGTVPADRQAEVAYRICVSLGKTKHWDQALQESLDFVKGHRGTVWEPRGLYWIGRLYLGVPHQGWKVGKQLFRGNDVPKTDSAEKPEQIYVGQQDLQNAKDALEAARVLYPTYRQANKTQDEEIELNFDLARVLQQSGDLVTWASEKKWAPPSASEWKIDPTAAYRIAWAPPQKFLYLYAQIATVAPENGGGRHQAALALFAEALFLRQYHGLMSQVAVQWENGQSKKIPYPYQDRKVEDTLRRLVREFPDDTIRDQAQFTLAAFFEQGGDYVSAVAEYRRLLDQRPTSKWCEDTRFHLQDLTRSQLTVNTSGPQLPGKAGQVSLSYRNVKSIHLQLYPVKLDAAIDRPALLTDPNLSLNQFQQVFGSIAGAAKYEGPLVAAWDIDAKDKGDYQYGSKAVNLPVEKTGAYVLVASAPGIQAANLVTLSDLALLQKVHRDGGLYFVTNASTGEPVSNASLVVKQWWWEAGAEHATFNHATSNAEGIATVPLQRAPGRQNFQMSALAYKADRYALTDRLWTYDNGDNPDSVQVFSTTDRAVYRPMQTVYYRQLVMRRKLGELKPVVNANVHVAVYDPKGKLVSDQTQTSSEFGSVHGQFGLSFEAPLGEYTVQVTLPNEEQGPTQFGGNRFRVEEYKKPEYEVTVTPAAERVKLGQPTTAIVHAEYYFGGPVPNAKVTYRVYRVYYVQSYRFPRPFDFLYRYSDNGDYDTNYRNGDVVAQGESKTDAKGDAKVTFATTTQGSRWGDSDLNYTVEADVQDESRQVITGSGSVKATKHDVAAFLNFAHGFATKGDRVDVEIMTLNPSDQPISVAGTAKVYRMPQTPDGKETLAYSEPMQTDSHGRAILKWTAAEGGYYRIAFETKDSAGEAVSGETSVWVDGPELQQKRFLFQGVFLSTENLYYEEGQTAKVLLVTPEPGCTVLLTREANNEIIERRVLHIPGRSLEVSVPVSKRDVPNVYLSANMIRENQVFTATQEMFVPPVRQFETVTVTADKAHYQPGEKAHLKLTAADWQGRPLRTELSVSVTDASLSYIQKDYAPDVRVYYYGDRRSQSIQANGSPGAGFGMQQEDKQPTGQFKVHQWLLPEGMGMLPDWPGVGQEYYNYYGLGYGRRGAYFRSFAGVVNGPMGEMDANGAMLGDMPGAAPQAPMSATAEPGGFGGGGGGFGGFDGLRKDGEKPESGREEANRVGGDLAAPTVRTNFADTAFWTPSVVTDATGSASVEVVWPDNLTQWRTFAVGNTANAQVGSGETKVTVRKDLLVRLEAPRFFVERDQVVLSADVHNYTPEDQHVKVRLDLGDDTAQILPGDGASTHPTAQNDDAPATGSGAEVWVDIPKDGQKRVDWRVAVRREGELKVRMTAQSQTAADATEQTFPVLVHGVERATAQSGVLRDQNQVQLAIDLPKERKAGSSELVVQLDPSLLSLMLDALPYLADYPYGCVEQTMSRFLPSVEVARTLQDAGYDLNDLKKRALLLEQNAQVGVGPEKVDHSPYSYPKGRPGTLRTRDLSQFLRRFHSPVFDPDQLKSIVDDGLNRIQGFQHADGGWGWWPGDSSDPFMTAYVLYGLQEAAKANYTVDPGMITRGLDFLKGRFLGDDNFHRMAYEARVLAMDPRYRDAIRPLTTGRVFDNRERLSAYSKALLALALHDLGEADKAQLMLRNIETTAKVDEANQTASWDDGDRFWWRWYNDRVETQAVVLQAYMAISPDAKLAPMMAKWLANNRRGNVWTSTRETAWAIYALCDYARVRKELNPEYTLTLDLGGRVKRTYNVTHENALFFDNSFVVPDELLQTGAQPLTITKKGPGSCYYGAYTRYFSLQEPIPASGNEIFVTRRYFKLLPDTASGQPVNKPLDRKRENPFLTGHYELLDAGAEWVGYQDTQAGPRYQRVPLKDGDTLTSGDLLEVELQLESKNDYDYLVFEDLKPAGCEPVEVRSGWHEGSNVYSNIEYRDQKVAFFLDDLAQGTSTLSYRLRAEIPGAFHVLPANGYAMYAPDIRAISAEMRLNIQDEPKPAANVATAKP